ncbi:MAG: hypothetical protein ACRD2C_05725 [Acidimicrobiales bacterium]
MSDFTRSRASVVAFVTSSLIGILGCVAVFIYGRRRPVGAPLSWGEAMAAAMYVFFMFFWWNGVIPHYWLTWADTELNWRSDVYFAQAGQALFGQEWLNWWPLDIPKQAVRDIIVVGIYGVALGLHVLVWALWQDRGKERPVAIPASRYGRPLVRKG